MALIGKPVPESDKKFNYSALVEWQDLARGSERPLDKYRQCFPGTVWCDVQRCSCQGSVFGENKVGTGIAAVEELLSRGELPFVLF